MPIIELKNVFKKYDEYVLKDFSIKIYNKDYIVITGDSGIGKTTLLNILGLLDLNFCGEYLFNGDPIIHSNLDDIIEFRQRHLSIVYQDFKLINRYTVYQNLAFPLIVSRTPKEERKSNILKTLQEVNLNPKILNKYPFQLSGGQKQRVAIARAIIKKPTIILADEPTGNLDQGNTDQVLELLRSLNITTIIVSHDPYVIKSASKVLVLD